MNRWITSIIEAASVDAVSKARKDIVTIAEKVGYQKTYIFRYLDDHESLEALHSRIDGITAALYKGDLLIYQYPCYNSERFEKEFIHRMKLRGIHVGLLIHDTELLRGNCPKIEREIFEEVDLLITHGDEMNRAFREQKISTPLVSKKLFDYIIETDHQIESDTIEKKLVIAGNLRKSIFLTEWSYKTPLLAYGRIGTLKVDPRIQYKGEFHQDELLRILPKNGIGLAWDSKIEGGGDYQNYTKYNAPHKISLYLALGMPIIVWDQSAAANIVKKYKLGFAVSSLDEIDNLLDETSQTELINIKKNVIKFSKILQEGFFTKQALLHAEKNVLFNAFERINDE